MSLHKTIKTILQESCEESSRHEGSRLKREGAVPIYGNELERFIRTVLTEANREEVITKKLHLPGRVATWAIGIDKKRAIVIANWVLVKMEEMEPESTKNLSSQDKNLQRISASAAIQAMEKVNTSARPLIDIVRLLGEKGTPFNIKQFETVEQALSAAKAEANVRDDVEIPLEEGQKVIMTFPDGYYWLDLGVSECSIESEEMGHCGSASGDTLISLRDSFGKPHVTVDYGFSGEINQIKGKENKPPVEKYHEYIVQLLLNEEFTVEKMSTQEHNSYDEGAGDLMLYQLTLEQQERLMAANPKLFNVFTKLRMLELGSPLVTTDSFIEGDFTFGRYSANVKDGHLNFGLIIGELADVIPDELQHHYHALTGDSYIDHEGYDLNVDWSSINLRKISEANKKAIVDQANEYYDDGYGEQGTFDFDYVTENPDSFPGTADMIVTAWNVALADAYNEEYGAIAYNEISSFFNIRDNSSNLRLPLKFVLEMIAELDEGDFEEASEDGTVDIEQIMALIIADASYNDKFVIGGRVNDWDVYVDSSYVSSESFNTHLDMYF